MEPTESKEERDKRYTARLRELTRIVNVYGAISRETRKYIHHMREVEPEGDFEKLALTLVGIKWECPHLETFEDILREARERRLFGKSYLPPEIRGLDKYLEEQFGQRFGEEE